MNREQSALWHRIQDFQLDDPESTYPFTARLAEENGWSRGFARRVAREYKRFVFLAMVAGHEATPSEQVDEAWHLHLTYTRSYWGGLCRGVLSRPLHHVPTRGNSIDGPRHREQYDETLASYRQWFGHDAPADIWPPTEIRFGEDLQHVRVNVARAWIIPKPQLWRSPRRAVPLVAGAWAVPIVWGVANPLNMQGREFLVFFASISIVAIVAGLVLRKVLRQDEPGDDEPALAPVEVACLSRGVGGVLQSCLASLVTQKKLEVVQNEPRKLGPISLGSASYKLRAMVAESAGQDDLERVMLASAGRIDAADPSVVLTSARPLAQEVESELQSQGLLESSSSFGPARWWPILIIGSVMLLGIGKLLVGVARDKPVGFLAVLLIGLLVALFLFVRQPFRTRRGERLLEKLKQQHSDLQDIAVSGTPDADYSNLILAAGLFGLATVHHQDIDLLQRALKPVSGSSGGCGSGCGGGGCGGGGCGGCGGD